MLNIALPKEVKFEEGKDKDRSTVIVGPCFPGYGITLGNSLRRVLLSSLPGAAAVGVKIKGVDHEFMTLPHIKEDILEIILNIKKLRLKSFSEEVVRLKLEAHGKKTVTAGDIEKNSQVEIANPQLKLAEITDMSGNLEAEIFVRRGLGYETVENREQNVEKEIGYIEIDSIFTPVISVGVHVENVRVGKMTNWDKLIIDITTDGTITPKEAFEESVRKLTDQFNALLNEPEAVPQESESEKEMIEDDKPKEEDAGDQKEESEEEVGEKPKKKRGRPKKSE